MSELGHVGPKNCKKTDSADCSILFALQGLGNKAKKLKFGMLIGLHQEQVVIVVKPTSKPLRSELFQGSITATKLKFGKNDRRIMLRQFVLLAFGYYLAH